LFLISIDLYQINIKVQAKVLTLVNGEREAGYHEVVFDGKNMANDISFI